MDNHPLWYCRYCSFIELIWNKYYWKCPKCGKPLDILYRREFHVKGKGINRYSSLLPFETSRSRGEGDTPLITEENGVSKLWFKLEYLNPSGSFKDRGTVLAIEYAYRMGYKRVVEDTSGNTGISVTMYSRIYGLKPLIIMPRTAPHGKKLLVKTLGGKIIETETRGEASSIVHKYLDENTYYVAHIWSPFYILGAATISYEVYEQQGIPDYVILPIGSGGLFLGVLKGFRDLYELEIIDKIPKFIVVEGVSIHPIYERVKGMRVEGDSSLADGIMVPNPPRIDELVYYTLSYGEEIVLVDNNDIVKALKELYDKGYIVEPTSAVVWAAYNKLKDFFKGKEVLLILTGSGLKTLDKIDKAHGP